MIFIGQKQQLLLNKILELVSVQGVSSSTREGVPGTRRVDFLPDTSQQDMDLAHAVADAHDTLTVNANPGTIYITPGQGQAGETVITVGGGLQAWNYKIYDAALEMVGSGAVADGELIVDATVKGRYVIEAEGASYATGYAEIEVR